MCQSFESAPHGHPGIPLSKLARQDEPILFYDEVTLFEDELHDNGVANLTIRIVSVNNFLLLGPSLTGHHPLQRIMPSGLFLLSRFFLRVDNVLFRIYDVRLYHDFATGEVIREAKGKEAPYSIVRDVSSLIFARVGSVHMLTTLDCACHLAPSTGASR